MTLKRPRYAILLSGQPRFRKKALESILKNIINVNNCDVFGHFWEYDDSMTLDWNAIAKIANIRDQDTYIRNSEYIQNIKEIIPFTKLKIQKQILFQTDRYHPGTERDRAIAEFGNERANHHFRRCNFIIQSQWYSIKEANKLRKEYEIENEFTYDGILRFRPDMFVHNAIDLSMFDLTKLYVHVYPQEGEFDKDGINTNICDMMAFGNGTFMDIYTDLYSYQDEILLDTRIDALLGGYPLGLFLKKYLGYDNLGYSTFNFDGHPVHNIITLPENQ